MTKSGLEVNTQWSGVFLGLAFWFVTVTLTSLVSRIRVMHYFGRLPDTCFYRHLLQFSVHMYYTFFEEVYSYSATEF